jgi:hypothetical protein
MFIVQCSMFTGMFSFKATTLALLAFSILPLHAQLPAPFPPGLLGDVGLMSLRQSPPFRAKITEKKGTAGNFTLSLEKTDGSKSTYTLIGGGEAERKMFAHFKLGSKYDFPKVFDDVLGKDTEPPPAVSTISRSPIPFFPSLSPSEPKLALLDLNRCAPFRARIDAKKITPDSISLTLACTDGRTLTLQHSGNARMDEALRIAKPLEEGQFYEFPMSVLQPHQDQPAPPTAAMKLLEPFIGEWDVTSLDKPDQKLRVRYHWKLNGTGLWREHTAQDEGSDDYRMANATLITYDSATGRYLETHTRPGGPPRVEKVWDVANRTLTSVVHEDRTTPARKIANTSIFKTDDRIDWKTTVTTSEGKFIEERQGRYTRIKP